MFPLLRQRLGTALDLVVEFTTLGEYRFGASQAPCLASAPPADPEPEPCTGGAGRLPGGVTARRTVAGGAAGMSPAPGGPRLASAATPAARRRGLSGPLPRPARCRAGRAPA